MFLTGTLKPEIEILFCNLERSECEKCFNYNSLSHGIEASVTWIEGRVLLTLLRRASRTLSVIGFAAGYFLSLVTLYHLNTD